MQDAGDLARPAWLASLLKIAVSAAYLIALFTVAEAYPQLYAGFVLAPLAGLTVVRQLRALTLRPRLRAGASGLEVRVWAARFMVPWVFEEARDIAWSELTGATVNTLNVNGLRSSSLVLAWAGGSIEIEPGVFAEGAEELQQRVLDRQARSRVTVTPERRAATASERFAAPIVVRSDYTLASAGVTVALAGLMAAVGDLELVSWFVAASLVVLLLVVAIGMVVRFIGERRVRHVELRAEGLAVGPSPTRLRVIAWQDIVYAQVVSTNDLAHALRIGVRDGRTLVLHGRYNYGFAELQALIDPPAA